MKKPILVGLLIGLAILFTGCARQSRLAEDSIRPARGGELTMVIQPPTSMDVLSSLPIDDRARALGTKIFATTTASVLRSPRDGAVEYYRVPRGTAMYVSPIANGKWLQVRLSKNRTGYVRRDQTDASLALALAQGSIADKARLGPKMEPGSEPDIGDGKSGEAGQQDAALDEAVEKANDAFDTLEADFDRLRGEAAGFQGSQADWPAVKDAALQRLNELSNDIQSLSTAINGLAAFTGKMSANDRNAFQAIVSYQGDISDGVQSTRHALTQMTEGTDWTSLIGSVDDGVRTIGNGMDGLRINLARL